MTPNISPQPAIHMPLTKKPPAGTPTTMELHTYGKSQPYLSIPYDLPLIRRVAHKGHVAITEGDAEVSACPGDVQATSHGGYGVGGHQSEDGSWNIAAAGPGVGFGKSIRGDGWRTSDPYLLEEDSSRGDGRMADVGLGAAGGAAVAVPATAAACCCCVIM